MTRDKRTRWTGRWSFVVLLVYFLVGIFGHYVNMAVFHAPPG